MSLVSAPARSSNSVLPTTPHNQGGQMPYPSESPTSHVSISTFETCEASQGERVSANSSLGHKSSTIDSPKAIEIAASPDVTPLSLPLDKAAALSWSLTWAIEQGVVDDAGEPELPDEGFVYSAKEERAELERRRLLWSSPWVSKMLKRKGFIPPPSPPPEIRSTRLRGGR